MKIAVIDGQGGGIGKAIVEKLSKATTTIGREVEIIALGTNSAATLGMIKAGANSGATGENAIKVMSNQVDIIIGTLAIIMEDSMMGEITQVMTHAINTSTATKILLPLNRCNILIAGTLQINLSELIENSVNEVLQILNSNNS